MLLGAVLAGGESRRFGRDKALAELDGHSLLAIAVDGLSALCDHVVVVGREEAPAVTLPDWPRAGMGPLGGIAAALRHAQDAGYGQVLSVPVDALGIAPEVLEALAPGPSCLEDQPVIGLWPSSAAPVLEEILLGEGRHSMQRFAEAIGARRVVSPKAMANINTPEDLAEMAAPRPKT